ncbi:hypothetical protein Vadar_033767 [Vaccinium darrowii]|nr:hypothetical protein Vadar_033767 [Vaccinium darrowii]
MAAQREAIESGNSSPVVAVAAAMDGSPQKPKIQMVQPLLREVESNKKSYDPRVVSIGPCHHGKPELQTFERLKPSMVRQHVENWGVKIEELFYEVVKVASDARKSYAEGLTEKFNDEEFTCMMLIDGCFTLHYICSIVEGNHNELNKMQQIALVRRDLLLLENQLPFQVLRVLIRASFGIALGEEIIIAFIKRIRGEPPDAVALAEQMKEFRQQHSLALKSHPEVRMQDGKDKDDNEPVHLLDLVRRQFIDPEAFNIGHRIQVYEDFRNSDTSKNNHRRHNKVYALELEACPDNTNDFGVTSYICFMDSIVDQEEDVKELRSKGILLNYLGTDKQVADLFNDISTELVPSPHAYVQVKTSMGYYYRYLRIQLVDWVNELKRDYFRSPWTTIAVFYAAFMLTLSLTQTYFTVFPSPDKH